jgi:malate dehydrogenase (oxaloacetate-decarboxylating)(NADP+)
MQILKDALANKGTAFTREERERLGVDGLLPPAIESLPQQTARIWQNLLDKSTVLERYCYLRALQDENETLFYRTLLDHPAETLPIVYTPTVGQACREWSRIYERPRGLYLCAEQRGRIAQVLANWPQSEVGVIVVTDGGRILGLGDLGVNGMGIPIGKLTVYTACGGVPPHLGLPVMLDVGTDNERLRADPLYLGLRQPRLRGVAYDELIEEFVCAVQAHFPRAVLQFEDFNNACAFALLQRYRNRLCCFNDDIQGTGAMGLAGLYAAGRITGTPLAEQRILFVGAGEACLGIGGMVVTAMQREGLSEAEARRHCWFIDSKGLITASRKDLPEHKRPFAQQRSAVPDLLTAVEALKPTALIGACAKGGAFTEPVLNAMARSNRGPIVFALSNPTASSECTAQQAYDWTQSRAIFAGGSPFDPVAIGSKLLTPGQANNAHIFPGVGVGLLVAKATRVTDEMLLAAARELAANVSASELEQGRIFPAPARMRDVAQSVALAVASVAFERKLSGSPLPRNLHHAIAELRYDPNYA